MMRCHMGEAMEDIDCIRVIDQFHTLAYILCRHAVVMLVERHIAVPLNRCHGTLSHLVACGRQWSQDIFLHEVKQVTP